MQQEGKISIGLKTAFPPPNATFQSNRSQWNWELDDVCLYWCGPLMSAPPLVSGSWSLQNTTILCPNLADIMNHDTGGSWGTSSQVQLYCESRFLENKFQDFNEARLLLSKKDYCWVRAHHIGDLGWESCSTAAAHQTSAHAWEKKAWHLPRKTTLFDGWGDGDWRGDTIYPHT